MPGFGISPEAASEDDNPTSNERPVRFGQPSSTVAEDPLSRKSRIPRSMSQEAQISSHTTSSRLEPGSTSGDQPPQHTGSQKSPAHPPTAPLYLPLDARSTESSQRPSIDKRSKTELSGRIGGVRARQPSFPSVQRRADTGLHSAQGVSGDIPQGFNGHSSSSSSSSSEDEESDYEQRTDSEAHRSRTGEAARRQGKEPDKDRTDKFSRFMVGNENYRTKGKVKKDGRLAITLKETQNKGYLAKALGQFVRKKADQQESKEKDEEEAIATRTSSRSTFASLDIQKPRLNICMMVIGSRGDAQPFIRIGKVLKERYGHRVRIATHPAFREFIEVEAGLEFFSVGGDPSELMAFMVKNPGMIPTLDAVRAGDVGRRRAAMAEMFDGFWRACIEATDDPNDIQNLKLMGEKEPFVADAIIANPPSFAHMHCAEALGIPMHLMFTFPYTPTQAFPHPLAAIKKSNVDQGYTNFISYPLVEMMIWQGLGDLINEFRVQKLKLDPVSTLWAPGQAYRLHIPITYLWSPGLVPKPQDWGDQIDISGFVFLDMASSYTPSNELEEFLAAGEAPVYIGFGSIVVDDPDRFTQMIFDAVKIAGVRALLSKGWGGLGGEEGQENVYMLDDTPHDWLFPKVRACVIHGGAGTTAMAIKCGKPTMVVPFFGDQYFWGSMLGRSGTGPEPVPHKHLTAEKLAEGIKYCLTDEAQKKAAAIARNIELEGDGALNAVRSFHKHMNLSGARSMRCSLLSDRIAAWRLKDGTVKLSPMAADLLVEKGLLSWRKLRLLRHMEWNDFEGPGEPVTGVASSLVNTVGNVFGGVGSVPYKMAKTTQKRKERKERRERRRRAKELRRRQKNQNNGAPASTGQATNGDLSRDVDAKDALREKSQKAGGQGETAASTEQQQQQQSNGTAESNGQPKRPLARRAAGTGTMSSIETSSTVDANPVEDYAEDVGRGIGKSAEAFAKAPVDLSLALAQGFHNAPRLYGDDTVRRPPRVTGMRSGLKAAGFEFVFGIYDGTTGVVRLPIREAKKEGFVGFVKGTGMGLTGFVLKFLSALMGPVGYTLKGVVKQAEKQKQPDRLVRRARISQGQREAGQLGPAQRKEVESQVADGWRTMHDLREALAVSGRQKGLRGRLRIHKNKTRTLDVFESVEAAQQAMAAIRAGEDISTVVDGRAT
ncbi:UDP-Glycosyltransferase/glycogen phosphorylase [Sodiomyces alkalinus F11]|uniref:UDP-Glycosyltransferase/glycogen phosphorylase n=1 Tax=Sodiomyces alkalinus (strain CBS 110278 / VKM F-3762 / F11) TaxID=1314773 RepID=A0A3N2PNG3_SODAK|nr:UDP-Glycosyltransferase/glycogen phosphorylase [Sodiomyces alkalinus F11]ROT35970.1 UDP-Glycosyltransferase/glycogen phosphorylase [Sodiomyces alkalinus F11]